MARQQQPQKQNANTGTGAAGRTGDQPQNVTEPKPTQRVPQSEDRGRDRNPGDMRRGKPEGQTEIPTDPDAIDTVAGGPYADVVDERGDNLETEEDESGASFEDEVDDEDEDDAVASDDDEDDEFEGEDETNASGGGSTGRARGAM